MSEITHTRIKKTDLIRLRALKVHDRQGDYEIIEMLLNEYDKLDTALCNDCR